MSTKLYHRIIDRSRGGNGDTELAHLVWDPTPWVVDVFTGRVDSDLRHEMSDWLRSEIGVESWPIHKKPGVWHFAGATVDGWTWLGFATEDMMQRFLSKFPQPTHPDKWEDKR